MHELHSHHNHQHNNTGHGAHAAPRTQGRTIRWARLYDPLVWVMALGQTRRLRSLPLELARLRPGERVLDVGCGTGDLALSAARIVGPTGEVRGIDAAPEMIEVANRKASGAGRVAHNLRFTVEVVEALSFPDGSFDVVLSSLMMHHLPGDLKARALGEIKRVLSPRGRLIVIDLDPQKATRHGNLSGGPLLWVHRRARPKDGAVATTTHAGPSLAELGNLAREVGFTDVTSGPTGHAWIGYLRAQAS